MPKIFYLYYVLGLKIKYISQELKTSESYVKKMTILSLIMVI